MTKKRYRKPARRATIQHAPIEAGSYGLTLAGVLRLLEHYEPDNPPNAKLLLVVLRAWDRAVEDARGTWVSRKAAERRARPLELLAQTITSLAMPEDVTDPKLPWARFEAAVHELVRTGAEDWRHDQLLAAGHEYVLVAGGMAKVVDRLSAHQQRLRDDVFVSGVPVEGSQAMLEELASSYDEQLATYRRIGRAAILHPERVDGKVILAVGAAKQFVEAEEARLASVARPLPEAPGVN
jgi:hypothetical protein